MADTKISAAGDAGVLIATDMVPLARSGNVNAFRATMSEVATYTSAAAPVQSVATRTGAVTLTHTDITDWAATLSPYAPLASPTFTGTPSLPTGAVAVTQTAGTSNTTLATTAFVGSALTSFAPLASPVLTGNPTAPTPAYGDNDTSVATSAFVQSAVAPVANNVGRNLVTNGTFVVAQRGAGPFAGAGGFGTNSLDRWAAYLGGTGSSFNVSQIALADVDRAAIGDEAARFALQNVFTGIAGAAQAIQVLQRIEGVRRLAGKTVTVSFWAVATVAGVKLGASIDQNFGTGGSPSTYLGGTGQSVTLATSWARYVLTFSIPSASGKTLGTNGDDSTQLNFWYSAGTNNAAGSGTVGIQSGTVTIYGVQCEIGSVPTPLDAGGTPQQILAECQRFYQSLYNSVGGYASGASSNSPVQWIVYPVQMRASPTVTLTGSAFAGTATAIGNYGANSQGWQPGLTTNGAGAYNAVTTALLSADL